MNLYTLVFGDCWTFSVGALIFLIYVIFPDLAPRRYKGLTEEASEIKLLVIKGQILMILLRWFT